MGRHVGIWGRRAEATRDSDLKRLYKCYAEILDGLRACRLHRGLTERAINGRKSASRSGGEEYFNKVIQTLHSHHLVSEYEPALRTGLFLSLYALCEASLRSLCDAFQGKLATPLRRGADTKAIVAYLRNRVRAEIPVYFQESAEGPFIEWIRNKLIHQNGRLTLDEKAGLEVKKEKLREVQPQKGNFLFRESLAVACMIKDDDYGEPVIRIDDKFNEMAHLLVHGMFLKLFTSCEARMKELTGTS